MDRDREVRMGAGQAMQRFSYAQPAGGVSPGIETGDVGDEGDAERRLAFGNGVGYWPADPGGAGLDQEQKTGKENKNAGRQVPKRRSP
jgi:hypothetical protein